MSEAIQEPLKILIADDEANIRRILETRLSMQGHEVAAAKDGAADNVSALVKGALKELAR